MPKCEHINCVVKVLSGPNQDGTYEGVMVTSNGNAVKDGKPVRLVVTGSFPPTCGKVYDGLGNSGFVLINPQPQASVLKLSRGRKRYA